MSGTSEAVVCTCRKNKICGNCYSGLYHGKRRVDSNPLRLEELAGLGTDGIPRDEDGNTPLPEFSEFQETVNPDLVAYLLKAGVEIYFTYPADKSDEVQRLFKSRDKVLNIRPLAAPRETTTTFRGGCSATVTFPTPPDMSVLNQYSSAAKQFAKNPSRTTIVLNDYKLGLQLHFNHGFELGGPK